MQINENKIAFFYYRLFFRIEIFQWVTGDSNKKTPPRRLRPQRAIDPTASIPLLHPCLQAGHPAGLRCRGKTNSINFGFAEEIVCWRNAPERIPQPRYDHIGPPAGTGRHSNHHVLEQIVVRGIVPTRQAITLTV
jgi:hypothetical protein